MDSADLPARWRGRKRFTIMETRFEAGLHFLAAWHAWRHDDPSRRCERLHMVSVESPPANWQFAIEAPDEAGGFETAETEALARELAAQWPLAVRGLHRLEFEQGRVVLTLAFDALDTSLAGLWLRADAFHLNDPDAIAEKRIDANALSKGIARLAGASATVSCEALTDPLRAALGASGFVFEAPGDIDGGTPVCALTTGHFAPKWRVRRYEPPLPDPALSAVRANVAKTQDTPKLQPGVSVPFHPGSQPYPDAMIIGAGLAGCALAERLSARGLTLALIDAAPAPATHASGNPAGVFHPLVSADDSLAARATRSGFLHALRRWQALEAQGFGFDWHADGLVQAATTSEEEVAYRDALSVLGFPDRLVQYVSAEEAYSILGVAPAYGGLYFPQGGMLDPASLCRALLSAASSVTTLGLHFNCQVATLVHGDGLWHAIDRSGNRRISAPIAIVTNAADASRLASLEHAPTRSIRGQLTWLDPSPAAALRHPLIGDGYVLPQETHHATHRARQLTGASYELDDRDEHLREDSQRDNLERLSRLVPAVAHALHAHVTDRALAGRVAFRCVTSDRMPMIGQLADESVARHEAGRLSGAWPLDLPRRSGLYGAYAYGSRGLTWATLGAEIIASQILGEPLPVTRDIGDGFDPARFLQRALRQRSVR
jgi:tRNA 5-methylaminomethyl-2-thiouridine biosynthesis bifunctional protein